MTSQNFPPPAFSFLVAISSGDQIGTQASGDGAFQEVSGIDPKVRSEGGGNTDPHQLPGPATHTNLVLKRGYVTQPSALSLWAAQSLGATQSTPIQPQTLKVFLLGPAQQALVTWTFTNAWPVKWEVDAVNTNNSSSIVTQMLEISYTTLSSTNS
jgi:phage tail-like protein